MKQTYVIFRKFKKYGDIIAIFPYELWNNAGNNTSYMHVGQHGACDYGTIIKDSVPAKFEEYESLMDELTSIGYNLVITKKKHKR